MDRAAAYAALMESEPARKVAMTRAAAAGKHDIDVDITFQAASPGRPARPALVHPARVPQRGLGTTAGRAALIHAIAHIEFNAINIALDAVCRFDGLPVSYYEDWMQVAVEEAHHFTLLAGHLRSLGHAYGDFPAHGGLWEMAEKTRDDVLTRMALVPRVLEARGLDVTPGIRAKLAHQGDHAGAAILDIILADEIGHVALGNKWYQVLCKERRLDPRAEFTRLAVLHGAPRVRPPFNRAARLAGGFSAAELQDWEGSLRESAA